jgi:hypothetical protein
MEDLPKVGEGMLRCHVEGGHLSFWDLSDWCWNWHVGLAGDVVDWERCWWKRYGGLKHHGWGWGADHEDTFLEGRGAECIFFRMVAARNGCCRRSDGRWEKVRNGEGGPVVGGAVAAI